MLRANNWPSAAPADSTETPPSAAPADSTETPPIETMHQAYTRLVDKVSANAEARNGTHRYATRQTYDGREFENTVYDPFHQRTYSALVEDDSGNRRHKRVLYPKIIYVHGLGCDASYFEGQARSMGLLGIASEAITLPRMGDLKNTPDELLEWQVGAVASEIQRLSDDGHEVVVIGHSRGAIVATLAADRARTADPDVNLGGLMLQGPAFIEAMRVKTLPAGIARIALMGINALRHDPIGSQSMFKAMAKVVISSPEQTITEARQAMEVSIFDTIATRLKDLLIDIQYGDGDEITVDMRSFMRKVLEETELDPSSEFARMASLTVMNRENMTHMLEIPKALRREIISMADPRTPEGQILAFLQSVIPNYQPPIVYFDDEAQDYRVKRETIHLANADD